MNAHPVTGVVPATNRVDLLAISQLVTPGAACSTLAAATASS